MGDCYWSLPQDTNWWWESASIVCQVLSQWQVHPGWYFGWHPGNVRRLLDFICGKLCLRGDANGDCDDVILTSNVTHRIISCLWASLQLFKSGLYPSMKWYMLFDLPLVWFSGQVDKQRVWLVLFDVCILSRYSWNPAQPCRNLENHVLCPQMRCIS